jgi:hypothetical protein
LAKPVGKRKVNNSGCDNASQDPDEMKQGITFFKIISESNRGAHKKFFHNEAVQAKLDRKDRSQSCDVEGFKVTRVLKYIFV